MSRRALRAILCATAALAFVLAAILPWFESRRFDDSEERDGARTRYELLGGERCEGRRCRAVGYTGAPGLRDDLFAGLGLATLAGALGAAGLTLGVAAVRRRHRPLRAWAAGVAATTTGLGALFVATEIITRKDDVDHGYGLTALVAGAIIAAVGVALPSTAAPPDRRPERRWALAAALAGGALIAWASLASYGWWHGTGAFRSFASSPLGIELCDGEDCQTLGAVAGESASALLARLTAVLAAVLLVPAMGAAARCAQDRAPGAWGTSAAILAAAALAAGGATAALRPPDAVGSVAWGLPAFVVGLLVLIAAAVLARRWVTRVEVDDDGPRTERAVAPAEQRPRARWPGPASPGPRPMLAPLGAPAPAPPSPAGELSTSSLATTMPYAPSPPAASLATTVPEAPPVVGPSLLDATIVDGPADATLADAPALADPGARVWDPPAAAAGPAAPAPSPYAPRAVAAPAAPAPSPYAPRGHHGPSPAWATAPREEFVPRPGTPGAPTRGQVAPPAPLSRRTSPNCPTCKQASLWHGKRGAWWCSACKRAL